MNQTAQASSYDYHAHAGYALSDYQQYNLACAMQFNHAAFTIAQITSNKHHEPCVS